MTTPNTSKTLTPEQLAAMMATIEKPATIPSTILTIKVTLYRGGVKINPIYGWDSDDRLIETVKSEHIARQWASVLAGKGWPTATSDAATAAQASVKTTLTSMVAAGKLDTDLFHVEYNIGRDLPYAEFSITRGQLRQVVTDSTLITGDKEAKLVADLEAKLVAAKAALKAVDNSRKSVTCSSKATTDDKPATPKTSKSAVEIEL